MSLKAQCSALFTFFFFFHRSCFLGDVSCLDAVLASPTHVVCYDTQIIFSFPPSETEVAQISACLPDISSWITSHDLKLNPNKVELLLIPGNACQDISTFLRVLRSSF